MAEFNFKMPQNIIKMEPDFVLIFVKKILISVLIFFKNRWQRCKLYAAEYAFEF